MKTLFKNSLIVLLLAAITVSLSSCASGRNGLAARKTPNSCGCPHF